VSTERQPITTSPRPDPSRRHVRTWQVITLWLIGMAPLLGWGLPTSKYDPLLFGNEQPWTADRYDVQADLQARRDRIGGADTDLAPLAATDQIVDLTADEAARAAILLRYRLFSRQPDEMITFMALQRMNPRALDFDPRLYQYGGGYIYLVGAALGLSSLLELSTLSSDASMYLSQPELFARFYIVARVVTLIFGALALIAVIKLARRAGGRSAGWIAFFLVAACPVFITGVLEAKPHIPSVCLLLWATLSALDYQATGRLRSALQLGWQTGYACGLVLTGLAGVALWPLMLLTKKPWGGRTLRHLALASGIAFAVYAATNPCLVYNLCFRRAALAGNLGNSLAMYSLGRIPEGLARVGQLLLESCGPAVLAGGLIALIGLCFRWPRQTLLAIVPGLATVVLCVAIGAGKPAEFARFLLLPAVLLAVGLATLTVMLARHRLGWGILAMIVALAVMRTPAYLHSFYVDAHFQNESRHRAARYIRDQAPPTDAIGVVQVPAPYATPPLEFARRTIRLLPSNEIPRDEYDRLPRWLVLTADDATAWRNAWWLGHYELVQSFAAQPLQLSRITWANKPVFVLRRTRNGDADQ
jgi:hypothetical protein